MYLFFADLDLDLNCYLFRLRLKGRKINLREFSYNFITSTYMTSKYFLVLMRNY